MRFRLFFFWNALGGITWGITYGLVGYFAGEAGAGVLARFGLAGAILLVVLFIGVFVFGYLRQRRQEEDLLVPEGGADSPPADAADSSASGANSLSPPAGDQEEAGSS